VIGPYVFIRVVTLTLGAAWTLAALVRVVRLAAEWQEKLAPLGLDRRWWRRQLAVACLRATVLDPLNLALSCALVALWTLGGNG